MSVATQISGNIRPGNTALHALKAMLTHVGIQVAHPLRDESLFYETDAARGWQHYDSELEFYHSIAHSSFHIIYNDGEINEEIGTQILYALLKKRPILMTGAPVFSDDLSWFTRETITRHSHQFHSIKLPELELTELSILLHKLKPTTYSLSRSETTLIKAKVRGLFRQLLNDAKELRIAKSRNFIQPVEES